MSGQNAGHKKGQTRPDPAALLGNLYADPRKVENKTIPLKGYPGEAQKDLGCLCRSNLEAINNTAIP